MFITDYFEQDDTESESMPVLNVSFSARLSESLRDTESYYSSQFLQERVYISRTLLTELTGLEACVNCKFKFVINIHFFPCSLRFYHSMIISVFVNHVSTLKNVYPCSNLAMHQILLVPKPSSFVPYHQWIHLLVVVPPDFKVGLPLGLFLGSNMLIV